MSRFLYRIEHYASLSVVALAIILAMGALIALGGAIGFPSGWTTAFEVAASTVTIVMLFAIQHTQGREQAAIQRKLDEILHALPGADESLMMLEEAAPEVLHDVQDDQRHVRLMSPDSVVERPTHDGREMADSISTEDV